MPHRYLGRQVHCAHLSGLVGTVVHVNEAVGTWRSGDPTFDVIWTDQSCTRRVALALIEGPGWAVLDAPAASPTACAQLWHEYQLRRVEEMSRQAADHPRAPARARLAAPYAPAVAPLPPGREITGATRDLLAKRFPSVEFEAYCDRRSVTVAWTDGPAPAAVHQALSLLVHKVDRLSLKKAHGRVAMRAAINYVLSKAFPYGGGEARDISSRLTCEALESGSAASLPVAGAGPATGLSYQMLVRCVLDRWDGYAQRFVDARSTAGLVLERQVLFSGGDARAAALFASLLQEESERTGLRERAPELLRG
jgi:hypothetical protein